MTQVECLAFCEISHQTKSAVFSNSLLTVKACKVLAAVLEKKQGVPAALCSWCLPACLSVKLQFDLLGTRSETL